MLVLAAMGYSPIHADQRADRKSTFVPASSISKNGFAINRKQMQTFHGREIRVYGFVDYSNVFKDSRDGRGVHPKKWRFNLKANPDAKAGKSFAVRVLKDKDRGKILTEIERNKLAGKPTEIYVTGKVFTFDAPTNSRRLTGLYIEVRSSADLSFQIPESATRDDLRTKR